MIDAPSESGRAPVASTLSLVGPACVAAIPVITALIVWLGPDPSAATGPSRLSPQALQQSLSEPRDKVVLIAWFIAAAALSVALGAGGARWIQARAWVRDGRWIWATLPGVLLLAFGLLYRNDLVGVTPRIGPVEIVVGGLLAVALVGLTTRALMSRRLLNALLVIGALALYTPVWLQLPNRLPDAGNAHFTLSEIAAVGAGSYPLHDFFPQYTQLLGFPIAPLLRLFPSQAEALSLGWVLLLQAATLTVAVAVATWAGGRRYLGPAAVIVPSLAFVAGPEQWSSFTYFGVNPLRTVLPVLAIAAACVVLRNPARAPRALGQGLLLVGLVAGTAALNNPDYGIPVVIIIWATALVAAVGRTQRLVAGLTVPLGAVFAFVLYTSIASAAGVAPRWSNWLLFPLIFGRDGFFNVSMPAIGWHVAGVTLFTAALAMGFVLLRRSPASAPTPRRRRGLALMLVGGWSLLTLPYYAGRSLLPTFLGGYSVQVGWTVACLLPLVVAAARRHPWRRAGRAATVRISLVLGFASVTACMAMLTQTASTDAFNRGLTAPVTTQMPSMQAALANAPAPLADALKRRQVAQVLGTPTLIALESGIRSAAVFDSPDYFPMSPALVYRQCVRLADDPAKFIVILASSRPFLDAVPECGRALDLAGAIGLPDPLSVVPGGFQAIPVR